MICRGIQYTNASYYPQVRKVMLRSSKLPSLLKAFGCSQWKMECRKISFVGQESTIYALATGGIRCGLAIIRVSGVQTRHVLQSIARFDEPPEPRKAILRTFYDPRYTTNVILDIGMLLWFPEPRSYTGEDLCEFIVHGGPAVITSFLKCIGSFNGCRMAEPGEFSKRAFLNGKIKNLTQVDGLHDLIMAETELQRVQAVKQMSGSLGNLYDSWRTRISKCLAFAEAYIDFGENDNIEEDVLQTVNNQIVQLTIEIQTHLKDGRKGERLRNGVTICIIGKPNSGKSTLLNLLCKREAAIVSDIPGTTRDVIEAATNLHGYPVVFADTAGLRKSTDVIESEGIRRAQMQANQSDIIILLTDWISFQSSNYVSRESFIADQLNFIIPKGSSMELEELSKKLLLVLNKMDLCNKDEDSEELMIAKTIFDCIVSCKTTENLGELLERLISNVASLCADPQSEAPYLTQERYRASLEKCLEHLTIYLNSSTKDLALKTNHLKNAINNIGRITGHVSPEEILDIIFRDFCIGK